MGMRPVNSFGDPNYCRDLRNPLVDKLIGDTYPTVRVVAQHLPYIIYLAQNLTDLRPKDIEIQVDAVSRMVQWRYVGTLEWTDLYSLVDVSGKQVEIDVVSGSISWRYVGDATWIPLIDTATLKGADGHEVEMRQTGNFIEWRLNDGVSQWQQIFDASQIIAQMNTLSGALNTRMDTLEASQGSGVIGVATKADLPVLTAGDVGKIYNVTNDPVLANNGAYRWSGTAFIQSADRTSALTAQVAVNSSDISVAKADMLQKAERPPLEDRVFEVESTDMIPILGITSPTDEVQVAVGYNLVSDELLVSGSPLLAESTLGRYIDPVFQVSDAGSLIPIIGVTDQAGNVQVPVAYDLVTQSLQVNGAEVGTGSGTSSLPEVVASGTVVGSGVQIAGTIRNTSGNQTINLLVPIEPPSAIQVGDYPYGLVTSNETRWYANPSVVLPYAFISDVTVKQGATTLLEGTDYSVFYTGGKVRGVSGTVGTTRNVVLTFKGLPQRYDLIVVNPMTGIVSVVTGAARNIDPQEYMPAVPDGTVPLFSVLSYGNVIKIAPMSEWQGTYRSSHNVSKLAAHNKRVLSKIKGALNRGRDITLVGYGDSITALGGNASGTTANGISRDTKAFFLQMPADTYAAIPSLDFGDGGGAIHTDLGWNRQLKKYLEDTHSMTVEYLNFGIGGTTSGFGENSGRPNGSNPVRLNAVVAAIAASTKPVLVNLAFGMNELGNNATINNMSGLVRAFQNAGATVQIIGVPRTCVYSGFGSVPAWKYTNDVLHAVALSTGAAFVPTVTHFDDDQLGYAGIFPENFAAAGRINHAGPAEFRKLSQLLISNFED